MIFKCRQSHKELGTSSLNWNLKLKTRRKKKKDRKKKGSYLHRTKHLAHGLRRTKKASAFQLKVILVSKWKKPTKKGKHRQGMVSVRQRQILTAMEQKSIKDKQDIEKRHNMEAFMTIKDQQINSKDHVQY